MDHSKPNEQHLLELFPCPGRYPHFIQGSGPPLEVDDLIDAFGRRKWMEVSVETCNDCHTALVFFDPQPIAFYLPAFIRAALRQPHEMAAQSLAAEAIDKSFRPALRLLSEPQRAFLFQAVDWLYHAWQETNSGNYQRLIKQAKKWGVGASITPRGG